MNIMEADDAYIAHTYARNHVVLSHGKGSVVFDEAGKRYLDLTAGIGVNAMGFAFDAWVNAVSTQAAMLAHVSNLYYTAPEVQVAKTLCEKTGFKKMMFANSGAEANEGAIKLARKYAFDKYGSGRNEIVTLMNSFHGRTITTLSATGQPSFHQFFDPFTPGFSYAKANDIQDLKQHVNEKTCAIMIELIQGEGGVLPLDDAFVKAIAEIAHQQDIILIVDEVQTGIGRTGSLYAYEQFSIQPDIVTTAKGLGGGLPIGGVLLGSKVEHTFEPGHHGTTFGGNPIACAGANAILAHMDETLYQQVREKGEYIRQRVMKMPYVTAVSGMGLMIGISLTKVCAKQTIEACLMQGLLVLSAKDKLRMLPPLNIAMEELDEALTILENVLSTGGN